MKKYQVTLPTGEFYKFHAENVVNRDGYLYFFIDKKDQNVVAIFKDWSNVSVMENEEK